jgi:hypothetical protein
MELTENQNDLLVDQVAATSAPSPKACPFCASRAEIVRASGQGFGVRCVGCGVSFPAIYNLDEVMVLWGQRRGTVSYRGGLASKGVSTRKKQRACRRNLKLARRQKKLKQLSANTATLAAQLRLAREAEAAEIESAAAWSRARLKDHEDQILGDPALRQLYALLKHA